MTNEARQKIAIIGAGGFVGRHLLAALAPETVDLVAVDRDISRLETWSARATLIELDLAAPPPDILALLHEPDILVDLAWGGLPNYKSLHHFETEMPAHYNFLKTLIGAGLPALLVTGTCFEYGMQSGALSEDLPLMPVNPYGFAKVALLRQLEFLRKTIPFSFTWARLFYLFGDDRSKSTLFTQLRDAVARDETHFDMSGGEQLRDYLPIEEVARLLAQLVLRRTDAGVVNVCAGRPTSVRRLVESWIAKNGWRIELRLGRYPYPEHEPMAFWGTRYKLDALLETAPASLAAEPTRQQRGGTTGK